jgi:stage II sporulation protein D
MSQWGAASMAQQGYGYREILGHYYQGASLSMLAMGAR